MARSTFKTLFYINRPKEKKNGKCPIMGRITIDGEQVQCSTAQARKSLPNFGTAIRDDAREQAKKQRKSTAIYKAKRSKPKRSIKN